MGQRPGPQGYPPAAQPGQQGGGRMNAGAFFDESALPDWLRQSPDVPQSPPQQQNAPRQAPPPAAGGGAFPSIEQAGQFPAGPPAMGGMPANSLLDSSALPQWLGGQGQALVPTQQQQPGYGMPGNDGLPAQSLVDEQALPQWLRAQPNDPSAQQPNSAVPRWIANPASNAAAPNWMAQPYADQQAAPGPAPSAPWQPAPPSQPPSNAPYGQEPPAGRMSANQFIDESALPGWLQMQGGRGERPAAGMNGAGMNGAGQPWAPQQPAAQPSIPPRAEAPDGRFSASDLIDPTAMPEWARGGEAQTFDSANGWSNAQRPSLPGETAAPDGYGQSTIYPDANGNGHGGRGQGMPAPLATSELPSWLQNGGQQYPDRRGQQQYAAQQDQGYGYGPDDGYGDYTANSWDEQPAQEYDQQYDYGQQDEYGSYGDQPDPYGASAGWEGEPYQQQGYPPSPNQAGYGRSQAAPPPDPRAAGRKDNKRRGWRAIFRRK